MLRVLGGRFSLRGSGFVAAHSLTRGCATHACVRQLAIDEEQLLRALEELLRIAAQMRPEGEPAAAAADAALLAPKV